MTRENFIKKRAYLFWYIKNPEKVSDEALVEAILNFGEWQDVQKLFKILKIGKIAKIFKKQINKKRTNYNPKIKNYFKLYFKKYA